MNAGISTSVIQRGRGGVGQYLFALLRGLAEISSGQRLILFVLEEDKRLFDFLNGAFEIVSVPERFRPPIANILWHQTELPKLCREHKLDVLHVPSYRRLLWNHPCARVATIHDLAPFRVAGKYDLARMLYGKVLVKRLARRQEEIIAVSQSTASDIQRFFKIPSHRIRVIHNGLEHKRFYPRDKAPALRFAGEKFGIGKPFFLYVARLEHPGKNHVRLIEAFEEFKRRTSSDWQLAFGGSDWHGAARIHERAANSPCKEDIRFLGFVSDEELPTLYSAASAFLYPSLYEGFGMPPVEAMACGCPVICSDRGSLGEVVSDAAVIVNPEDTHQIASALSRMTTDEDQRKRLIQAGFARAADFSWEKAAAQTLAVYHSASNRNRRSFQEARAPSVESVPAGSGRV